MRPTHQCGRPRRSRRVSRPAPFKEAARGTRGRGARGGRVGAGTSRQRTRARAPTDGGAAAAAAGVIASEADTNRSGPFDLCPLLINYTRHAIGLPPPPPPVVARPRALGLAGASPVAPRSPAAWAGPGARRRRRPRASPLRPPRATDARRKQAATDLGWASASGAGGGRPGVRGLPRSRPSAGHVEDPFTPQPPQPRTRGCPARDPREARAPTHTHGHTLSPPGHVTPIAAHDVPQSGSEPALSPWPHVARPKHTGVCPGSKEKPRCPVSRGGGSRDFHFTTERSSVKCSETRVSRVRRFYS